MINYTIIAIVVKINEIEASLNFHPFGNKGVIHMYYVCMYMHLWTANIFLLFNLLSAFGDLGIIANGFRFNLYKNERIDNL
jgi:hypothetical protein